MTAQTSESLSAQSAHAEGSDGASVARLLADQLKPGTGTLGMIYVSDLLAGDLEAMLSALREHTGVADWVGTVSPGICANGREYFDTSAAAALVLDLPKDAYEPTWHITDSPDIERLANSEMQPVLGVVHGDPRNPAAPELIAELSAKTGAFLVGGMTASRSEHWQIANTLFDGGISGVLFSEDVPVVTALSQGCSPVGPVREVGECDGQLICELDGGTALGALEQDLGIELDEEEFANAVAQIHVAIMVEGSDTGDYMVRNLMGIEPENGWLAIGDMPEPGQHLMFCRRDAASADKDLQRMLGELRKRAERIAPGAEPRAGLYHSCLARGPNLFGYAAHEVELIAGEFGDFPLIGFFGNGEISHDRLYGYTGVLTLFY